LQGERILPIDAAAHRIRCLPITESFGILHDQDQRQPPGGLGRLTPGRKQGRELLVLVEDAELIAHPHIAIALGERQHEPHRPSLRESDR
jgi:hypothetical protein